jgi:hypothetical protein
MNWEAALATRIGTGLRWVGVGALVLGVAGSATAQSAGPTPPAGQVGFERAPQLSPQDELAQADAIIAKMDQSSTTVRRQLDAARQGRDVVRSLCLSDKLSQVDVAARSARDRQGALQAAVQRGDSELANHEFTILTVLRQRTEQLGAEANQCIGEEVAFVGQTQVVSVVDPNLPGEDNTAFPPDPGALGGEAPVTIVYPPPTRVSPTE